MTVVLANTEEGNHESIYGSKNTFPANGVVPRRIISACDRIEPKITTDAIQTY